MSSALGSSAGQGLSDPMLSITRHNVIKCLVVIAIFHSGLKFYSLISSKAGHTRKKWNSSSTMYTLRTFQTHLTKS